MALNIQHQTEEFGIWCAILYKKEIKNVFTSRAFLLTGQYWPCGPMRALIIFHASGVYVADRPMLAGNNNFIQIGLILLTGQCWRAIMQIGRLFTGQC